MSKTKKNLAATLKDKVENEEQAQPFHIVVEALAGTGKTFTMIVGVVWALAPQLWDKFVQRMKEIAEEEKGEEIPNFDIVPSDEQKRVWEAMGLSKGVKSVVYCAFNKSIVTEFGEKWGWIQEWLNEEGIKLTFATVNSLGNRCVNRAFGRVEVTSDHTINLLSKITGKKPSVLRKADAILLNGIKQLVSLSKLTLVGWERGKTFDPSAISNEDFDEITRHYDIDFNGFNKRAYKLARLVLRESLKVDKYREIDFDDQNWLPVVLNLPTFKFDLMMIDESQDLPRCKQEFGIKSASRVAIVGDVNQAIYGFAGADVNSIPRMRELLTTPSRTVETFYLNETRRCPHAVVDSANRALARAAELRGVQPSVLVAHPSNSQGEERELIDNNGEFLKAVKDGDMCVCRTNGPPVSYALKLLRAGRKAVIRGRDFGKELENFVKRMEADDVADLVAKTEEWYQVELEKENKKRNPSETKLINLQDRRDCVLEFCKDVKTIEEVLSKIQEVFAGKECPTCKRKYNETYDRCTNPQCKTEIDPVSGFPCGPMLVTPEGVLFSSVHRAKGLEAKNVYILAEAAMPHPMATTEWQVIQEWHLRYVAITRSMETLTWVYPK